MEGGARSIDQHSSTRANGRRDAVAFPSNDEVMWSGNYSAIIGRRTVGAAGCAALVGPVLVGASEGRDGISREEEHGVVATLFERAVTMRLSQFHLAIAPSNH